MSCNLKYIQDPTVHRGREQLPFHTVYRGLHWKVNNTFCLCL